MSILAPVLIGLLALPPGSAGDACPPAHERSEWRITNLLTYSLLPELKKHVDLGTASAEDVRLLVPGRDDTTCRELWKALAPEALDLAAGDRVSFYHSGNRYFVPISRHVPPGVIRLDGPSTLNLYDSEFRLIARLMA